MARDPVQIAAIALAVAVLVAWFVTLPGPEVAALRPAPEEVASAPEPPASPEAPRREMTRPLESAEVSPREGTPPPAPASRNQPPVTLENDALRIAIAPDGGRVLSVRLKRFRDRVGPHAEDVELATAPGQALMELDLGEGVLAGLERAPHRLVHADASRVELEAVRDEVRVVRNFALDTKGYGARLRVRVENRSSGSVRPELRLVWHGVERASDAPDRFQNYSLVAGLEEGLERTAVGGLGRAGFLNRLLGREVWRGEEYPDDAEWVGIDSQYFLAAALAENPHRAHAAVRAVGEDSGQAILRYPPSEVPAGQYVETMYRLYLGPKLPEPVNAVDAKLNDALRVGWSWARPFVDLFAFLLVWTYDHVVSNYGVAIILLTILLRVLTFPLTQKSMTSMRSFSSIQPEMKALQEKYKGDRERLQQEMMALYKRKGINPLTAMGGGCLPMVIQMPFLIALYFALQGAIELRHAPFFGWIDDLSAPETLFSVAGVPIRALPLAMGTTMVLQNRLMPTANTDPQQRQMMMWMSVFFIFLFYRFPSGLVLYWFVSNLLGIGQQVLVNWQGRGETPPVRAKE